jgi:two-component system, cell cycle response regulator
LNILVIEDNPSHLKLAHHVLSAAGYHVNGAEAAEQAVAAIKSDKPELILLDLELPGMDGLALVKKLKADPETRNIHIVAVTSYPERYPKAEILAAGCAAYITKPINTRTLPRQLEELMQ